MKTLRIACPTCGAHLDVDFDSGQARCRFCKEIFQINDGALRDGMNGAEQMGYDFERGRQRANVEFTQGFADRVAEARRHMPAMDPAPVYVPEPVYTEPAPVQGSKVPVWLIILLWLVFPPAGMVATIVSLVRRSNGAAAACRVSVGMIILVACLMLMMIGMLY